MIADLFHNFSYGRAYSFAPRCTGFYVTSFSFKKEVTKKVNPAVPSGTSLRLPRYIAYQERLYKNF